MSLTSIATAPLSVSVGVVTVALEIGGKKKKDKKKKDESKKKKPAKKKSAGPFATKTAVRTFRNLIRLLQIRVDHITFKSRLRCGKV